MKNWHSAAAAVAATLAAAAAFGFISPGKTAERTAEKIEVLDRRVSAHDVDIVGIKKDIDYAARGIEALLEKEGLTPRRRRRAQ